MYFKQFYLGCLAHASYLIGSEGEGAVVDPQRDVEQYLADEAFRKQGVREKTEIIYASAAAVSFQVKRYAAAMDKVIGRKGIEARYRHNLIEIRPGKREAVFEQLDTHELVTLP